MENSTSSVRKSLSSSSNYHERTTENTFEESTWTMYFEDFLANKKIDENKEGSLSLDFQDERCTFPVPDAASLVEKRSADNEQAPVGLSTGKSYNRLSFKKKKTKEALFDDDLEDTATSPVNSPKEKGSATSSQENERSDLGFLGTESDFSEMKKRELCFVPLSRVVNYLG